MAKREVRRGRALVSCLCRDGATCQRLLRRSGVSTLSIESLTRLSNCGVAVKCGSVWTHTEGVGLKKLDVPVVVDFFGIESQVPASHGRWLAFRFDRREGDVQSEMADGS